MADESRQTHGRHGAVAQAIIAAEPFDQHHRQPTFQAVKQQRGHCRRLVARTQHVGRAGVFAAIAARVIQAKNLADNDGK
jgi:hypothetical protein